MTTDKWGTPQLGLPLPRVLLVSPIFSSAIDIGRCYFYRPHRESNNVTSWQASEMRREKGVGHPIPLPTLFGLANPWEMPSLNRLMGHLTPTEFIVSNCEKSEGGRLLREATDCQLSFSYRRNRLFGSVIRHKGTSATWITRKPLSRSARQVLLTAIVTWRTDPEAKPLCHVETQQPVPVALVVRHKALVRLRHQRGGDEKVR